MRLQTLTLLLTLSASAFAAEGLSATDPAAVRIDAAQKAIATDPDDPQAYLAMAAALCRKARDSEDIRFYNRASAELEHALILSPANFEARKLQVAVLLGKNELSQALKLATELNRKTPDDISVWGLLAEINTGLGNYEEAMRDAQWVLDLRPGSTLGFMEAARLREAYGDFEGAREFNEDALRRLPLSDLEERAWLLVQTARESLYAGDVKGAASRLDEALKENPESGAVLLGLARLRLREGDAIGAVKLLEQRHKTANNARTLYDLAAALERAGMKDQAEAAFREFEAQAKAEQDRPDNANLQLVLYYADHGLKLAPALELATREAALRHDFATLDSLSWALYANGRYTEAKAKMAEALTTGVRDPSYFCHAAKIAAKVNDADGAKKFVQNALSLDPAACTVESK